MGRNGKERERNKELKYREREREKDNLYRTTFGLVKIGKTYIGVGKERKKEEGRERGKKSRSRHRMSHTNHESSVRLNYCIPTKLRLFSVDIVRIEFLCIYFVEKIEIFSCFL